VELVYNIQYLEFQHTMQVEVAVHHMTYIQIMVDWVVVEKVLQKPSPAAPLQVME